MKITTGKEKSIHVDSVNLEKHIVVMVDEQDNRLAVAMRTEYAGDGFKFQLLTRWDLESGNGWEKGTGERYTTVKELIDAVDNDRRTFHAFKTEKEFFKFCLDYHSK